MFKEAMLIISCVATALLTVHSQRTQQTNTNINSKQRHIQQQQQQQSPVRESPCPNVFTYEERGSETDQWFGTILLSTDVDLNTVWIEIQLDKRAEQLGNWYGEVSTNDNKLFTITNRKKVLRPGPATPVRIFVKYNELDSIPNITHIQLNGRRICTQKTSVINSASTQTNTNSHGLNTADNYLQTSNEYSQNTGKRTTSAPPRRPQNGIVTTSSSSSSSSSSFASSSTSSSAYRPSSSVNKATVTSRPTNTGASNNRPSSNTGVGSSYNRPAAGAANPNGFADNYDNSYSNVGTNENTYNSNTYRPSSGYTTTTEYNEWVTVGRPSPIHPDVEPDDGFLGDLRPTRKPVLRPLANVNQQNNGFKNAQCGLVASTPKPLITHGIETIEGKWPWHAALYRSAGIDLNYICGGSLVSTNHVITAAHCVAKSHSNQPVNHQFLLVYLGKYSLRIWTNDGIQDIPVEQIILHPQYNYTVFHNDVAVLKLKRSAKYTDYVRPICLWREKPDLNSVLNREGTVVGWGFDENGRISDKLAMAKMPVVSQEKCLWSKPEFFSKFATDKTYCAGFRNGTSVCNGDSGGGMVFAQPDTYPQIWQLRGLVSISVALQNISVCDPYNYVVFTDLAKHQQWVESIMNYS